MKRQFAVLLAVLAAACTHTPPPVVQPPPPPPVETRALHVFVADDAGTPLVDARCDVSAIDGEDDGRTNGDGYWGVQLPPIPEPDAYRLECHKDGYGSAGIDVAFRAEMEVAVKLAAPHARSAAAWHGQLQLRDGAYVDGFGSPVLPVCLHAGDLFGRYVVQGEAHVEPVLETAARAGYNCLRSWTTLNARGADDDWWSNKTVSRLGPRVTADYRQHLVGFARALMRHGLRWHQAQGDLIGLDRAHRDEVFDQLASAIDEVGAEAFALVEALNEARDTGMPDPLELERLINRVRERHPQVLYGLSAYTGHEENRVLREWTPSWMQFFIVHGYRGGHWYDKRRHVWSLTYDGENPLVRWNAWQGEPGGGAGPNSSHWVSAQDNEHEWDDESAALIAAAAWTSGQAFNFMCSPCVIYDSPFEQEPGFASVPRMAAQLAARAPDVMRYTRRHHSGDTWRSTRVLVAKGEVRIDGAQADDGRFAYTIDGPSGRHTLQVVRGFEGELIHPGTGEVEPVSKRAGDILVVEFLRGRVLVGRVVQ